MTAEYITSPAIAARHGFFTRRGGVSTGAFASLNCSLSSPDDRAAVTENRARVQAALGAAALVGCTQVHGAEVAVVTEAWAPGQGPRADAMVTDRPGIALGVITADCTPVLLHHGGVVGAVHAGLEGRAGGRAGGDGGGHGGAGRPAGGDRRGRRPVDPPTVLRGRIRPARRGAGPRRGGRPVSSATAGPSGGSSTWPGIAPRGWKAWG